MGVCFLFSEAGELKAKFGGELGTDGVNGDDVQLKTLGTADYWFVQVFRAQQRKGFTYGSDVYAIRDGFPLAFRISGFPNELSWTDEPYPSTDVMQFQHFFHLGKGDLGEMGIGADNKEHTAIIGWDNNAAMFRGPSKIHRNGAAVYKIDLMASRMFVATDLDSSP